MPSNKKVLVRTSDNAVHPGYLPPAGFLVPGPDAEATVELLDLTARILPIPLAQILHIAFVRDFNLHDPHTPENLLRRTFLARPRTEGLWLRLTLTAADPIEGLAPLDTSLLDHLLEDRGLYLIPPDIRSNTQRLYIPRTAITSLRILAVITTPSKPKPATPGIEAANPELPFPLPAPAGDKRTTEDAE